MKRDSLIFYRSFYEAIRELPSEQKAEVYDAIFSYALDFKEPELSGISKTVFTLVKPQLSANIEKYKNGTKPKQKTSKTEADNKQEESKLEGNVNDNVNENDNVNQNVNVVKRKKKTFSPPTLDEVKLFFLENKQTEQKAVKAFMFYSDGGWKDSNGKQVQNWKQKMRVVWFEDEKPLEEKKYTVEYANAMGRHTLLHTEAEIEKHTKSGYNRVLKKQ